MKALVISMLVVMIIFGTWAFTVYGQEFYDDTVQFFKNLFGLSQVQVQTQTYEASRNQIILKTKLV